MMTEHPAIHRVVGFVDGDEALGFDVRMAAGAHYLRVAEFAPQQGLLAGIRTAKIYEEAITTHRGSFPLDRV